MFYPLYAGLLWHILYGNGGMLPQLLYFFPGAIELSILSEYYRREIAAYDIQTTRCDIYGQVCIIHLNPCIYLFILGVTNFLSSSHSLSGYGVQGKGHADLRWHPL